MWWLSKVVRRYRALSIVSLLLILAACSGDAPDPPAPELSVVEFATEAPQPTVIATNAAEATAVPPASTAIATPESSTTADISREVDENPLTGLKVDDPALLQRRPLMVRLGNDPIARPQVALNEAEIVYEELVEWWVTRFTAIFLVNDPEMIAPIRSARLINLQLTPQYRAALANSGGSDPVRWELSQTDIINLDEYFVPQPYFYRDNEGWQTRLAVNAEEARNYLLEEGLDAPVNLRGFSFDEEPDLVALRDTVLGNAEGITIPYPENTSKAYWEYDGSSGQYLRFTLDEPLLDFSGEQVSAANVIIYFAEHQDTDIVEDSTGATSIRILVNGKGPAWVMRDGKFLKGYWETNGRETPLFTFENGQPIPLKPGRTWVQIVPLDYAIDIDGIAHQVDGVLATGTESGTEGESE